MTFFKPFFRLLTFIPILLTLSHSELAFADVKSVKVISIVDHPALDKIRDGIQEQLKTEGFVVGKNLRWEYQSAQGNMSTAAQIARKFIGERPDAIVAIATPAAQAVAAATKTVPIVYAGISDPIAAQLIKNWGPSGTNITGVSDKPPLKEQIAFIKSVAPKAKKIGIVYNPGEANSVVVVRALKTLLSEQGMQLIEAAAPRTVDIPNAATRLIGKVDVIFTSTDNNVVSAYESLARVARRAKIPLIASDMASTKRGAMAALGVDYNQLGHQAGTIVAKILRGEKPGTIPSVISQNLERVVNLTEAKAQGVVLSEAILQHSQKIQ